MKKEKHWYVLRAAYGSEKRAYEYITNANEVAFYPTRMVAKRSNGKVIAKEESLIPNIFFAYGTFEKISSFVYDNANLPYLRFYYRYYNDGKDRQKTPLIVPDRQMESFRIICKTNNNNVIFSENNIEKFEKGQLVRVIDGQFKGVVGRVARYHGQQRVGVMINGLVSAVTAYVPSAFIEKIG